MLELAGLSAIVILFAAACADGSDAAALAEPMAPPPLTATPFPEPTAMPQPPTPEPTAASEPTPAPPTLVPPATTTVPSIPTPTETPIAESNDEGAETEGAVAEETRDADGGSDDALADDAMPSSNTVADPAGTEGASVFDATCADCHGPTGSGTGKGPSIKGIGQFFPEDVSPLLGLITNGGTDMPEFGSKLNAEQISAVVQYVVATFR